MSDIPLDKGGLKVILIIDGSKNPSQPFQLIVVRRIAQHDVNEKSFFHDALGVGERIEACLAVILPDTTVPNTAEG
jgi:hypothetical protein